MVYFDTAFRICEDLHLHINTVKSIFLLSEDILGVSFT